MRRRRAIDMSGAPACPTPPTPYIVHWASGDVACCRKHANALLILAMDMGSNISGMASPNPNPFTECSNCQNELAKNHDVE
jgi:hypothetical protein